MDAPPEDCPTGAGPAQTLATEETDADLVHRAKQGDRAAFDRLMLRYQQEIISVAYRMLGNYEEAIDVSQEAFLRMWRGLPRFRQEAAFRSWAYQITLNLARHRRRWHARHRTARTVSLDVPANDGEDPVHERIQDCAPNPREEAGRAELQAKVQQAIARLPVPLRTAVVLRDIQGLPYDQIAGICKEQIGTVKSRLHRGRTMLRKLLEGVRACR